MKTKEGEMMLYDLQSGFSSRRPARSPSETLRQIETQVEALLSRHSGLTIHKRAIERQLSSIVAQIHEPDVLLTPRAVFLVLEMRGSGGVSEQLEQIARIVHEQGYWKPNTHVQNYRLQDVYHLGKSAQRLFDDSVVVDQRVEQLYAWLGHIKQRQQMEAATGGCDDPTGDIRMACGSYRHSRGPKRGQCTCRTV